MAKGKNFKIFNFKAKKWYEKDQGTLFLRKINVNSDQCPCVGNRTCSLTQALELLVLTEEFYKRRLLGGLNFSLVG